MKPNSILVLTALLLAQFAAVAAPVSFTGSYSQNFDSLGTAGTTMPAGFRAMGLAGANTTYSDVAPITTAAIAAATISSTTSLTIWNPGSAAVTGNDTLFNEGSWGNTANRALGTSPTSDAATVIELSMTNNAGGSLGGVVFSYDLKVQTNGSSGLPTQLAGYAFFYSLTGGTAAADWTKVPALSLTNNVQGNTYGSGNVTITFPSALAIGGIMYFRWADDNDASSSPDQMIAVDNISISALAGVSVSITNPAGNATFAQPASLLVEATANSTGGSVTNVEFFVDGNKIGEDASAPYSVSWNSPSLGVHSLAASARDNAGNAAQSVTNTVKIVAQSLVVVTRGPYLQLSTPTSIVIRWRTDVATDSRVLCGVSTNSLNLTNDTAAFLTDHEITLTGLTPDTRYFYAVGTASRTISGPSTNLYFYTHPLPGTPKPTRVWVIGDAGTGDANQTGVRDKFWGGGGSGGGFNGTNRVHVWLQLGDNAYDVGSDAEYQTKMFDIYTNILRNTVTWPTLGNHETVQSYTYADTYPHFLVFTLPTAGQAGGVGSGAEHYYSFDYGMVHFICLDSMTSDLATNTPASGWPGAAGAMAQWLRDDLAATTNRWVIAYWHHPPYTKGSHDSDSATDSNGQMTKLRERFLPILEAGGVDLVLCGHSHVYERTCLINGHYGLSGTFDNGTMIVQGGAGRDDGAYLKPENASGTPIGGRGAVYTVCGCSGGSGSLMSLPAAWSSMMQARFAGGGGTFGSMVLDITTNRLDARFLTIDGATNNDWFTIRKDNWAPVASNSTVTIKADLATNLFLKGSDINRNAITFATHAAPTNGLVSAFNSNTGAFTYTPARGATNGDSLRFIVSDGSLTSTGAFTLFLTPPVDANGNGLADGWEAQYGVSNPNGDPDGDGVSNLREYWAGTNPTNALSWLRMTAIGKAGVGYQVVWSSVGGTRYRLCYGNGDAQGGFNGAFTPVPRPVGLEMDGNPVGQPGTMSFTDDYSLTSGAPPNGNRYYRVQVVR